MAESSRVGSYRCEFIDDVPEHLVCGLCKHAANGPSITMCCGELFCKACIASALEEKRPCPSCKEPTFSTFLNPKFEKSIKNLRVHCTMKDRGCQWTGQLEQLDTHLEVETGDCEHVDIECPEKCGQQIQKRQLAAHIANECPERDFVCQYCGFKATYVIISNKHWPECQNYPVPCPNECSIGAVERNILEDHLNTCPLQVVECDFSYAGCNKKLQRQDMEKHVEESTREHLTLMAAASVRMSREFEKMMQEQRDEFQGCLKQEKETTEQLQQYVRNLQESQDKDRMRQELEQKETAEQFKQKDKEIKHFQESFQETQKALQVANEKLQQLERQNVERNQTMQAQIVDVRNQMERRDKQTQKELEQKIQVLTEQLQQKKREIQNLQQADERLRENLQRNARESKEKEKQLQEQLQVKHEQAKQQIVAVEKQLKTESKEFLARLMKNEQQTQQVNQKLEREVQQLQRKHDEFQTKHDRQTEVAEVKMTDIEREIQEKTTQIEKRVHDCESYNFPPIILTDFKPTTDTKTDYKHMTSIKRMQMFLGIPSDIHNSQHMYTHSGGYNFYLRIYENVRGEGQGTHVSVELVPCKGLFDGSLRWPAKCTITLQLLNQHRDQDHHTVTKELEWQNPIDRTRAVTFSDKFIAHDDLKWNAEKHTQYLKDDCLHFRISRVDLK